MATETCDNDTRFGVAIRSFTVCRHTADVFRYAVFGDSYVTHLERHYKKMQISPPHRFFGQSGMGTRKQFDEQFQKLTEYQPRAVFINLGGDDISPGCKADRIFWDIVNITEALYEGGVEKVFVASIIERGRFPVTTELTRKKFNVCRRYINKKLKGHFGKDFVEIGKRVQYPKHYNKDLVHPGHEEGGMKILRHFILKAFKKT